MPRRLLLNGHHQPEGTDPPARVGDGQRYDARKKIAMRAGLDRAFAGMPGAAEHVATRLMGFPRPTE